VNLAPLSCDSWIGLGWGWAGDQIGGDGCGCKKSKEKMEDREDCRKDTGDGAGGGRGRAVGAVSRRLGSGCRAGCWVMLYLLGFPVADGSDTLCFKDGEDTRMRTKQRQRQQPGLDGGLRNEATVNR
jgi:hypothetical protein